MLYLYAHSFHNKRNGNDSLTLCYRNPPDQDTNYQAYHLAYEVKKLM